MATQSQLVMRMGPNPGKVFSLTKAEISIGRDISNDIVINDAEVSRKHARLIAQGDQYILEDLGSTNGTFINGQRIAGPHMLTSGETIQMGDNVSVSFESTRFDPDATAVMSSRQAADMDATAADMPSPMFEHDEPEAAEPEPMPAYELESEPEPMPAYEPEPEPEPEWPPPMPEPVVRAPAPMPSAPADKASTFTGPTYSEPEPAPPMQQEKKPNRTPIFVGCGCLLLLVCALSGWALWSFGDQILVMFGF